MTHSILQRCSRFVVAFSVVLAGCGQQQPAQDPENGSQQQTGSSGKSIQQETPNAPAATQPLLTDEQIASVRQAVERCAGTLRCDAEGQPVEIDLAVGRGSADEAAIAAAVRCSELRILRARAGQIAPAELDKIRSLTKLEELMLHDAAIDDQLVQRWAEHLPYLKQVTLRNTPQITDRAIAAISKLPQLTHLALIDLQITNQAVESLANAPTLAVLDLRMCNRIDGRGLAALAKAPKLKELKIGSYGIDDDAVEMIAGLPHLESLTIEDASIGADALAKLASNKATAKQIQVLTLARCSGISDEALLPLSELQNLRRLTLRDVAVTGTFLQTLSAPEDLELLSLNQTFLSEEAFDSIAACSNLKRLELAGNFLTLETMKHIAKLRNLQYLNLSECGLNDEMLELLADLSQLETLIVEGNPDVSPEVIDRFRRPADI